MLTAQPSTYDMFGLIELYGRKIQSDLEPHPPMRSEKICQLHACSDTGSEDPHRHDRHFQLLCTIT